MTVEQPPPGQPATTGTQAYPLKALWDRRAELSGHASTHVRTSALAGLGVAWLFAGGTTGALSTLVAAPRGLLLAAAVFAASLGADILHYFLGAASFRWLARRYEKRDKKTNADLVEVPPWVPAIPTAFYNLKVLLLFAGYAILVLVFLRAM